MKMIKIIILFVSLVFTNTIIGQYSEKVLWGTLVESKNRKKSIPNAEVKILGIDETRSDKFGNFSLDLSSCHWCTVESKIVIQVNWNQGSIHHILMMTDSTMEGPLIIPVPYNNTLIISGIVRDRKSGKFIEGIKVKGKIDGIASKIKTTDMFGHFEFIINSSEISDLEKMLFLLIDSEKKKYKDREKLILIKNKYHPTVEIFLEYCAECTERMIINVNDFIKTNVFVNTGDSVIIQAGGKIFNHQFDVHSGPDGLINLPADFPDEHKIFSDWPSFVLCYRFGALDKWKYYKGSEENEIIIKASGFIEFMINHNGKDTPEGKYKILITTKK